MVLTTKFPGADAEKALAAKDVEKHLDPHLSEEILRFIRSKGTQESEVTLEISSAYRSGLCVRVTLNPENIYGYFRDSDSFESKSRYVQAVRNDDRIADWHQNI